MRDGMSQAQQTYIENELVGPVRLDVADFVALPEMHSKEPGSLIRAGTAHSCCVIEIRGRDVRNKET